ncbi:MAG: hypothetical protein PWP24_1116, partial [Clostridiales bacterium]|nr:hypothetical protein [Clostridiales bacterium]
MKKISTKILFSIMLITLLVVITIGSVVVGVLSTNVGALSSDYAYSQVDSSINKIEQKFDLIETLVNSLSAEIVVDIDVKKGKEDIKYLRSFCDEYEIKLREIGLNTKVSKSIYVYFNNGYFGDTADCWVYGDEFVRQPMIGLNYFKDYYEWYN